MVESGLLQPGCQAATPTIRSDQQPSRLEIPYVVERFLITTIMKTLNTPILNLVSCATHMNVYQVQGAALCWILHGIARFQL